MEYRLDEQARHFLDGLLAPGAIDYLIEMPSDVIDTTIRDLMLKRAKRERSRPFFNRRVNGAD